MAFDFKKEYKEFYLPKTKPALVTVPPMNYLAMRGKGDPNEENGAYQQAIGLLYGVAYTIKMSKKGNHRIEGYFDYVVPPLEGFWQQDGTDAIDYAQKADFAWAVQEAAAKKKQDFSAVEFLTVEEGLCVQCMHIGPYDKEPETVAAMDAFLAANGYTNDLTQTRRHHEIYLSDVRKTAPDKLKTVIRHPIRRL